MKKEEKEIKVGERYTFKKPGETCGHEGIVTAVHKNGLCSISLDWGGVKRVHPRNLEAV